MGSLARHNGQLLLDPDTNRGARFKVAFGSRAPADCLWIPSLQGLRQFRCLERPDAAVLRLSFQLY